jgi:putative metallohydrolase (TIGR04338 family)
MEVRDSQKSRHYAAERFLYDTGKTVTKAGTTFNLTKQSSINDCQNYLNIICEQYWFRQRFGDNRKIIIQPGRNGGKAYGSYRITLGTWARNEAIVLHELAHCLAPYKSKHGPEFAGIFLFLVKNAFGNEAAKKLRESYKTHKVRYNNKAIPPINKNCLTNSQVNALADKNYRLEKQRKKEMAQKPLGRDEQEALIKFLSRAINAGQCGEVKSKTRTNAQKVVRDLKKAFLL